MNRQLVFSSRVGDRWTFAIEFEGVWNPRKVWNEWYGYIWLWVDGEVVGMPSEFEMVTLGLDSLIWAVQKIETGSVKLLGALPLDAAVDLVIWARFGDEGPPPTPFEGDRSLLSLHEVLPGLGAFFDDWQAILIKDGSEERFIYRREGAQASETRWPAGTFKRVVLQAQHEFRKLATEWSG